MHTWQAPYGNTCTLGKHHAAGATAAVLSALPPYMAILAGPTTWAPHLVHALPLFKNHSAGCCRSRRAGCRPSTPPKQPQGCQVHEGVSCPQPASTPQGLAAAGRRHSLPPQSGPTIQQHTIKVPAVHTVSGLLQLLLAASSASCTSSFRWSAAKPLMPSASLSTAIWSPPCSLL